MVNQYDFRFVEGEPSFGSPASSPLDALSKQWIGDHVPRKIDMLSLMSMSDAFFGRVFLARRELIPFGTVSITTYFHTASDELAAEDITRVLAAPTREFSTEVTATSTANCGRRRDGCSRHDADRLFQGVSEIRRVGKGAYAPCPPSHQTAIALNGGHLRFDHPTILEGLAHVRRQEPASPCSASPSRSGPRNSEP